jgi:hypothetical protein
MIPVFKMCGKKKSREQMRNAQNMIVIMKMTEVSKKHLMYLPNITKPQWSYFGNATR